MLDVFVDVLGVGDGMLFQHRGRGRFGRFDHHLGDFSSETVRPERVEEHAGTRPFDALRANEVEWNGMAGTETPTFTVFMNGKDQTQALACRSGRNDAKHRANAGV